MSSFAVIVACLAHAGCVRTAHRTGWLQGARISRPFDVVIFGATGCCGQVACEHLAQVWGGRLSWAIAGRRLEELEKQVQSLKGQGAAAGILFANIADIASLRQMAAQTRVVCSFAGPYAAGGTSVVQACVQEGTHYCDISGETAWVRGLMLELGAAAAKAGVAVVPFCGIDALPADLGTLMLVKHMQERYSCRLTNCKMFMEMQLRPAPGGVATFLDMVSNRQLWHAMQNMNVLLPNSLGKLPEWPVDRQAIGWDREHNFWVGPYLLALVDRRVVRCSADALEYGPSFVFEQAMTGSWHKCMLETLVGLALKGLARFVHTFKAVLIRRLLRSRVPPRSELNSNFFLCRLFGRGVAGEKVQLIVHGGDPAIVETSKMAVEAAVLLAERGPLRTGIATPAMACGIPLVQRLRDVGISFDIQEGDLQTMNT